MTERMKVIYKNDSKAPEKSYLLFKYLLKEKAPL